MNGSSTAGESSAVRSMPRPAVGHALRKDLYAKVSAILVGSNEISDSNTRLLIQACCLDVVSALEDLIERFGLDESLQ